MPEEISIEWHETPAWRFYNYAVLHTVGIDNVFNLMRYDHAFLIRPNDVAMLLASANDKLDFIARRFAVLLCKTDEKGITRPGWSHGMLLSTQEYEEVKDAMKLYDLAPGIGGTNPFQTGGMKHRGVAEIEANLAYILKAMLDNRAFPDDEGTASRIEQAFHAPNDKIKVKLAKYALYKEPWFLPKQ